MSRSESDLHETGIFIFLTLVIFFVVIGFPTLINTSPSYGYDENTIAKLTPVTTFYQEAYAEQEEFGILSSYYFDPVLSSVLLVMPTAIDNLPPEDPLQYFERKYSQGIQLEFGFIEFDSIQEFLTPNINKSDFLPPIKEFLDFEVLPKAFAGAPPPPIDQLVSDTSGVTDSVTVSANSYPDPEYYYDFDSTTCIDNICINLGTAGSIGDANHTTDDRSSTVPIKFSPTSVLGQGITINGTDSGGTQTEVHLGDFADRGQWDFLWDDNAGEFSSLNFWVNADLQGGGGVLWYNVLGMGKQKGSDIPPTGHFGGFVHIAGHGEVSGDADIQMYVNEKDAGSDQIDWDSTVGLPDDNQWHMVSLTLNKSDIVNTAKICVDRSNCQFLANETAWNATAGGGISPQELTIGQITCDVTGGDGCNNTGLDFDELAVWSNHILTDAEINYLYNEGEGNRVLLSVPTVQSACESDIAPNERIICYSFDSSTISNDTVTNLGTLGTVADAFYYVSDVKTAVVPNATGKFGQAIFQDGTGTGGTQSEIRLGEFADRGQWDFLHTLVGSNLTSINFWINGDVDGAPQYPLVDTYDGGAGIDSFAFFSRGAGNEIDIFESSVNVNSNDPTSKQNLPPDDGQWHMLTILMDKGNVTSFSRVYLDAELSTPEITNINGIFAGGGGIADRPLTIGGDEPVGSVTENAFNIDDFAMWQGYQLTDADITALFSGFLTEGVAGVESVCDSAIGESFRVGCYTFDTVDFNGVPTTYLNLGTLSNVNAQYFESGVLADFESNSTGIINQAVFQNGTGTGGVTAVIQLGDDASVWNFLHTGNVGDNVTSINFWINGDIVGAPVYPIFNTGFSDLPTDSGFSIWTQSGTTVRFTVAEGTTFVDTGSLGKQMMVYGTCTQ